MAIAGTMMLAVVVDEFTSSPSGGALANAMVRALVDDWSAEPSACPEVIEAMIKGLHAKLRYQYPLAKAAYAVLAVQQGVPSAWALVCGDCRVGRIIEDSVAWLTDAHTLQATADLAGVKSTHEASFAVTRCFKPSKWHSPQKTRLVAPDNATWAIATDGFASDTSTGQDQSGEDDASCIFFSWEVSACAHEELENWYVRTPAVAVP